jgi:hypothetical protein
MTSSPEEETHRTLSAGIDFHAHNSVGVLRNAHEQGVYHTRLPHPLSTIVEQRAPDRTEITGVVVASTYH